MSKRALPATKPKHKAVPPFGDEDEMIKEAIRLSLGGSSQPKKAKTDKNEVISLLDSSDDESTDGGGKVAWNRRTSTTLSNTNAAAADDDDDVEIVEPASPNISPFAAPVVGAATITPGSAHKIGGKYDDSDIVALGTRNEQRLPHMRQHCTTHPFVADVASMRCSVASSEAQKTNAEHCDLCYCYVCDAPVKDCSNWSSIPFTGKDSCHCLASDKGKDCYSWKQLRDSQKRDKNGPSQAGSSRNGVTPSGYLLPLQARLERLQQAFNSVSPHHHELRDKGPFPPTNEAAMKDASLTQCRKCEWFSKFEHNNFKRTKMVQDNHGIRKTVPYLHDICDKDWCHNCGRIASSKDFGKVQSKPYTPKKTDVFLGTKTIQFRIKSHDPRKLDPFKKAWEDQQMVFEEAEMEKDMFDHRIGQYPVLDIILGSVPVVSEDKIPTTGRLTSQRMRNESPLHSRGSDVPANEIESLLLCSPKSKLLLDEINKFGSVAQKNKDHRGNSGILGGEIKAAWNKIARTGEFTVSLYIQEGALIDGCLGSNWHLQKLRTSASMSFLLGTWFDILPFKLSSISGSLAAKIASRPAIHRRSRERLPIPPWELNTSNISESPCKEEEAAVTLHNASADNYQSQLFFTSSTGKSSAGGICKNATSLPENLKRFCAEILPFDYYHSNRCTSSISGRWEGMNLGIKSFHREMRRWDSSIDCASCPSFGRLGKFVSYIRHEDVPLVVENLSDEMESVYHRTSSLKGLLQQLENLGHRPAPPIAGINVTLKHFQQQAVGWAIERENMVGGVQSAFWTRVPIVQELYFSPILDMFRTQKPARVRGGIIAEEMGLGKTVISLALILQNPAPALPKSGSMLDSLSTTVATNSNENVPTHGWTKETDIPKHPPDAPSRRGSILCTGTLVICNVSLVGQWIDEAKAKLVDPGLVYAYHGANRIRDSKVLAQNAIVVTTYATLSSDSNYHAKKAGADFCPPCEQIRWWRIICDESHALKDGNTQTSKAIRSIDAEIKWCVTGTPMCTSVHDLKNQLHFLGISDVDKMFSLFDGIGEASSSGIRNPYNSREKLACVPNFLFLMRSLMIRHSMHQKCREGRSIMVLPEKLERIINVSFDPPEQLEYNKLEATARNLYTNIKNQANRRVSHDYLKILQMLMPLRRACSGGTTLDPEKPGDDKEMKNESSTKSSDVYEFPVASSMMCSICNEHFCDPVATKCKPRPHTFCRDCIEGVIYSQDDRSGSCPQCNQTVTIKTLQTAAMPDGKVSSSVVTAEDPGIVFTSKFRRLLTELTRIRDEEPEAKSLVFSQFKSTLSWMQEELPKHGFQFRTLSGDMPMSKRARALRDFQNDPPTTIFLLSIRAGACGINLTQANRVFLMEPAMNPALEAQAIGRVYRLGQRKNVEIVRMLMTNSVETRLTQLIETKYGSKDKKGSGSGDNDDDDSDKKDTMDRFSSSSIRVGSIQSDRSDMRENEFDLLFGLTS